MGVLGMGTYGVSMPFTPPQSMASTSRHEYAERWDSQTTRQPPRNRGNPHPAPPPPTQKPLLWPTPPTTDPAPRRPGKLPRLVHPYRPGGTNHGDGTRTPTNPKAGPGGGRVAWEESECSTCVFLVFFYSCFCMDGGRPPSCFSRTLGLVAVSCLGGAVHGESSPELGGPVALSALLTPSMARRAPRLLRSARVT